MVDRTTLSEATAEAVGFYDGVEEAMPDAFRVLLAAARAVVEAPEINWCEEHEMRAVSSCKTRKSCRVVRVFLVPAEEESV
jgi:hypothetical protein